MDSEKDNLSTVPSVLELSIKRDGTSIVANLFLRKLSSTDKMSADFQAAGISRNTRNAMPEIAANNPDTGKRARAVVVRNVRRVHFIREDTPSYRNLIRPRALRLAVETPPKGNDRAAFGQGVGS